MPRPFSLHQVGLLLLLCLQWSYAFLLQGFPTSTTFATASRSRPQSQRHVHQMIANPFQVTIPRSIKEGVKSAQTALQQALKDRISRMEIVFPRGVALGVEAPNLDKGGDIVDQADRELGRLIVEMLLPLEDTTVVVFREERQAQKAQRIWGDSTKVKIKSFEAAPKKAGSSKKKKKAGFGGQGEGSLLPQGTEVFIVVAPGPAEMNRVMRIQEDLGPGTLVIMLNSRIDFTLFPSKEDKDALLQTFVPIFSLGPIASSEVQTKDNMLLFRAYPNKWVFAQKPGVGAPRVLEEKEERFTQEELMELVKKGKEFNDKPFFDQITSSLFG